MGAPKPGRIRPPGGPASPPAPGRSARLPWWKRGGRRREGVDLRRVPVIHEREGPPPPLSIRKTSVSGLWAGTIIHSIAHSSGFVQCFPSLFSPGLRQGQKIPGKSIVNGGKICYNRKSTIVKWICMPEGGNTLEQKAHQYPAHQRYPVFHMPGAVCPGGHPLRCAAGHRRGGGGGGAADHCPAAQPLRAAEHAPVHGPLHRGHGLRPVQQHALCPASHDGVRHGHPGRGVVQRRLPGSDGAEGGRV